MDEDLEQRLDNFKEDSLIKLGKLLGERISNRELRDRILYFRRDIEAVNAAEDKEQAEQDSNGKE